VAPAEVVVGTAEIDDAVVAGNPAVAAADMVVAVAAVCTAVEVVVVLGTVALAGNWEVVEALISRTGQLFAGH
jgi:hypothetical protein